MVHSQHHRLLLKKLQPPGGGAAVWGGGVQPRRDEMRDRAKVEDERREREEVRPGERPAASHSQV